MASIGQPLMPWQRYVADVGLEMLSDGRPAYREIICTVPRQSGKTSLMLGWELHRALLWGRPQRVVYAAQTLTDGWDKLITDQYEQILKDSPVDSVISKVRRVLATPEIVFRNGSRIRAIAASKESGHGKTLDLAVIDEAWADKNFDREQAVRPTMVTRPDAQILVTSAAGDETSVFLREKVEIGRNAVKSGRNTGVAYFEWAADDDIDPFLAENWWSWMPALGHTIEEDTIEAEMAGMSPDGFLRAYGNLWTTSFERVIPRDAWDAVTSPDVVPKGGLVFAADAKPDLSAAAIAVADSSGRAELVETHDDAGWVTDRLEAFAKRHNARVAIHKTGPLGFVAQELEGRRVDVIPVSTQDYKNACGAFFTNVMDQRVAFRTNDALTAAVTAARRLNKGDSWIWTGSNDENNVSPLVAATLALGAAFRTQESGEIGVMLI